ncbi:hypothetical protein AB0B50_00420 [Streptomyces sp. NPDC041068]|uniref:hypothetical protein n=1 Tax=Streptomyces sp. NPDC041068 TaxID=3155130 RepID=UPI0033FA9C3C
MVKPGHAWSKDLMGAGEADRALELHTGGTHDVHARAVGMHGRSIQQHCLADARLPGQQERAAGFPGLVDEAEPPLR